MPEIPFSPQDILHRNPPPLDKSYKILEDLQHTPAWAQWAMRYLAVWLYRGQGIEMKKINLLGIAALLSITAGALYAVYLGVPIHVVALLLFIGLVAGAIGLYLFLRSINKL